MLNTIAHTLKTLFSQISQTFRIRTDQDAMEDYLSQSMDAHDLEARQRRWDQSRRASIFFH